MNTEEDRLLETIGEVETFLQQKDTNIQTKAIIIGIGRILTEIEKILQEKNLEVNNIFLNEVFFNHLVIPKSRIAVHLACSRIIHIIEETIGSLVLYNKKIDIAFSVNENKMLFPGGERIVGRFQEGRKAHPILFNKPFGCIIHWPEEFQFADLK